MDQKLLPNLENDKPILIAGPTATGKSALGLRFAQKYGGVVINADALQVYADWNILTARPSSAEVSICPHRLYGHIPIGAPYSTGAWIKEVATELDHAKQNNLRPIILGGTGLNFQSLTNGIAEIPPISDHVKSQADVLETENGKSIFATELAQIDPTSLGRMDANNPMRTRRAWEVFKQTNRGISDWQDNTPAPLVALHDAIPLVLQCDVDWLNNRIERRFDMMVDMGALDECKHILDAGKWMPNHPSCKAIGAREIIAHLQGDMDLDDAITQSKIQTRQYAKRQRTWFRSKMKNWHSVQIDDPNTVADI